MTTERQAALVSDERIETGEAEAVAEALYGMVDALSLTHARIAIAALDRLRDARSEDEGRDIMDVFRSDEAMEAFGVERRAARVPQDEDHEEENDKRRP